MRSILSISVQPRPTYAFLGWTAGTRAGIGSANLPTSPTDFPRTYTRAHACTWLISSKICAHSKYQKQVGEVGRLAKASPVTVCAVQPAVQPLSEVGRMSKTNLREQMPVISAWVDSLREAFGKESIDGQIRKGMQGEPTFFASENGQELGTRIESNKGSR